MKEIVGDLVKQAFDFDVIVHGCNCFCIMGAGIAYAIAKEFPEAVEADDKTKKGSYNKLGTISYAKVKRDENVVFVVNAYTQYKPGLDLDLDALRLCFRKINKVTGNLKIGIPMIGAGIAGGDWNKISEIIEKELESRDVTVVVYDEN